MRFVFLLLLTTLIFSTTVNSQIVEASVNVDKHIFQIETEVQYAIQNEGIEKIVAWSLPSLMFRYGLFKNVELQLNAPLIKEQLYENDHLIHNLNLFDHFQFGISVNLWKQKNILPEAAIMTRLIFPLKKELPTNTIGKIISLNLSNTITEKLLLTYNIGYTYDTNHSNSGYYIVNLCYNLNSRIHFFIENFADLNNESVMTQNINMGGGYNLKDNITLDFSVANGLNHNLFYTSVLLTWAINTKQNKP